MARDLNAIYPLSMAVGRNRQLSAIEDKEKFVGNVTVDTWGLLALWSGPVLYQHELRHSAKSPLASSSKRVDNPLEGIDNNGQGVMRVQG